MARAKKETKPTLTEEELRKLTVLHDNNVITDNSFMRAKGDKEHYLKIFSVFAEKAELLGVA